MANKLENKASMQGAAVYGTPLARFNSASRAYMGLNQSGQGLDMKHPDLPRLMNGFEKQTKDFCIQVKTPCDLTVVDVLNKYVITPKQRAAGLTSPKVIIYVSDEDGTYDYLETHTYAKYAEYFGMKYDINPIVERLKEDVRLPKGLVLASCQSIKDGFYTSTVNVSVAALSIPGSIEDGVEMSEELRERMTPRVVGSKQARWGKNTYLVWLYGDKPFPEPGDTIRDDGLLFAIRDYDPILDAVNLLEENICEPDLTDDRLVYAQPGALVYDIDVLTTVHDNNRNGKKNIHTPESLTKLAMRYHGRQDIFNKRLIEAVENIPTSQRGQVLSSSLQTLAMRAIADRPSDVKFPKGHDRDQGNINRLLNAVPLEEFNIEIHFCKDFELGLGAKVANLSGGKGVACRFRPRSEMPVDDFGNVADLVLHGTSVISRLIGGQLYEQYMNAASRDVTKDLVKLFDNGDILGAWTHLEKYLSIISPTDMGRNINEVYNTDELRLEYLSEIVEDGIRVSLSIDDPDLGPQTYMGIKNYREPDRSTLTITDYDGRKHRTTVPVLIGDIQMMVLEKSATKPQAECIARLQNNGLPASSTVTTRDTRPINRAAGRCIGETEGRSLSSIGNSAVLPAEIMELSTNPEVSTSAVEKLFTAESPMHIPYLVDRREIPLGRSRSIGLFKHLYSCAGAKVVAQNPTKVIPE